MKCHLCSRTATEKHHITYYPERTIGVCAFHGDEIHRRPSKYPMLLQYSKGIRYSGTVRNAEFLNS